MIIKEGKAYFFMDFERKDAALSMKKLSETSKSKEMIKQYISARLLIPSGVECNPLAECTIQGLRLNIKKSLLSTHRKLITTRSIEIISILISFIIRL